MAQLYNNAIENEIEIQLQRLYNASGQCKLLVMAELDAYILSGERTSKDDFMEEALKLFDFNAYEGKAFEKQEKINREGLAKQFEDNGYTEQEPQKPTLTSIEAFKIEFNKQVEALANNAYAQLMQYCTKFDQHMADKINERDETN